MVKANSTLKTVWQYGLGLILLLAVPIWGTAQTFIGAGNPQDILDATTTTSAATAAGAGVIGVDVQIDMVELDITHTFDGDLEITLISPMGTTLDLSSDNGVAGDDYTGTIFMDGAPPITGGSSPFTGAFAPEGGTFAAVFDGEPIAGDWVLSVFDDAAGDTGTLNSYSITFGPFVAPPPPTPITHTFCGAGLPANVPVSGSGTSTCSTATNSIATSNASGIIGVDATLVSVELDITHTFDNDLEISLISPMGTILDLSSDNGGAGDDYTQTVFMDGAPSILTGSPPFTGTFEAEGGTFAATFAGESILGDWTLSVCDDLGGDTGTLNEYCINFNVDANPGPANDLCAGALPIACDETVSGTTIDATIDDVETGGFCGTSITAPGVWYSFVSDGSTYTASTCNAADYDTKISVFTGSCDALVCVAGNDDGGGCGGFTSLLENFTTVAGETYFILVHGFSDETGNFDLTLTCCAPPDAVCQDIEIVASNDDPIIITPADVDGGSTADCGGLSLSLDNDTFICLDDGPNNVTLTATDQFGNTDDCVAVVTIINTFVATEVGCIGDVNVTLGADCSARITPAMVLTGHNLECASNIEITVDGGDSDIITGCGQHTYVAEIFDENGNLLNTCWGDILAEDKTDPVIDCPANTDEVTQEYDAYQATGVLAVTDPVINLNNYSCLNNIALDGDHNYDLITFTTPDFVIPVDVYTILLETSWGDGNMALFQGGFDPDNPCENIIGTEDDAFVPGGNIFDPALRLSLPLQANTSYTLLVTNWNPADLGAYTVTIYSDNNTGLTGGDFTATSIEETRDLVCEDIDAVRFLFPRSYIVNADGSLDFNATRNTFFGGSTAALNAFIAKLELTGFPDVSDNCGQVLVTLSDVVDADGDCGDERITRTFTVADRYNSTCTGAPRTATCDQVITFRKPTIGDLVFPPFVVPLECDENFAVDANGNPHPSSSGYPWLRTAFGFHDLAQSYCNLGASYSDEPRIVVCEGTYKLRRQWNIIDWCNPSGSGTLNQLIKVLDATGPDITGVPDQMTLSTSPFGCYGNFVVPNPGITDGNGCSTAFSTGYTVLLNGDEYLTSGNIGEGDVVQLPIGEHRFILCAEDDCGNETCVSYSISVEDRIEPTASCDDDLNVSIGGGDVANGIEGIARIFATDVDEGSNDNCGEVTLEVRRNHWRNDTCHESANRWSPWGPFIDFYCCDIANEITIELRVTDEAGNENICWMTVVPEDKLNPHCYAPEDVELTCSDLPLAFPGDIQDAYDNDFAATSAMMNAIFGGASGTDNCAVDTIVERTPNIQINECGWGVITRRFEAWQLRPEGDVNGNGAIDINEVFRSTNNCSQDIVITEVHDFVIDFPEDADADCGDPDVPTIITEAIGCDVLSVNIGEPVIFAATGDECYKYSVTYDVINWCLWDGEYTGYVLPRMTEDDGEPLPVDRAVEGNERPVVTYDDDNGLCIDRRHNDRDGDSSLPNCFSPDLPNYGRYIYTQFVKVYDSTAPVVAVGEYGGPTDLCPDLEAGQFGDVTGNCETDVTIPFSVTDECELFDGDGNLVVSIVSADIDLFAVDANGDGTIKSNEFVSDGDATGYITDNGDGTYSFDGSFPIITSAMGDNVVHAFRVLFEDGCGNQVSEYIEFDVIDCKGPAPICINGLTVTLMPQDDGGCAMAIWANDFEGSPIYDCTGQGPETNGNLLRVTKYAIYRAEDVEADPNFVPSPDDTGLVLTQDDDESTVVYIYAFDEEGNYDYCETYVLVQQHVDCGAGTGTLSGVIMTENDETVEGVEVNVNGGLASMTTNTDGTFSFELPEGGDYSVTPYLNANPLNGVSTFDLVLMSKHILGVQPLDSPYKHIAADVNRSQTITTLDMIQVRKLILNIDTEFANNTSWRFVAAAYVFPQPANPWFQTFPELISENNLVGDILDVDFIGVKIGDINGNAQANALSGDDRTLNGQFNFEVEDVNVKAGNVYTVAFTGADMASVEGFQGTLSLNGAELVDIEYGVASAENFGLRYANEGMITASWNGKATAEDVLFSLVIRPTVDAQLSDVISVNSRYTAAEAYGNGNTMDVGVSFFSGDVAATEFELYQNTPNPFQAETLIGFNLPEDAEVTLTINDASGRVLTVQRGDYAAGYNTINVSKEMVQGATGVLSYTISSDEFTATKTMVAVK